MKPTKVTVEITKDGYKTTVFSGEEIIDSSLMAAQERGGFQGPIMLKLEKLFPEFANAVDGFDSSQVATELQDFDDDIHPDLDTEE